MTVKDDLYFVYDGKASDDLGIINVSVEEVWVDEPFLATAEVSNVSIKGRDKPYFMGITRQPLRLNLTFAFVEGWDEDLIQEVATLFHTDYYKPLYFSENEDRIFYCMYSGDPRILHYKLKQGYIEMELVCNDICAYSRVKEQTFNNVGGTTISFSNRGNIIIYPEITLRTKYDLTSFLDENNLYKIEILNQQTNQQLEFNNDVVMVDKFESFIATAGQTVFVLDKDNCEIGDIQILIDEVVVTAYNKTDNNTITLTTPFDDTTPLVGGEEVIISWQEAEEIYIDNDNEIITSNTELYRYDKHNGIFLKMMPGRNNLVINNTIQSIKLRWQFKLLQG